MLIIDPKAFAHSLISSEQQGMMTSWNAQGFGQDRRFLSLATRQQTSCIINHMSKSTSWNIQKGKILR
jgi:hypothetical protein